VTAVRRPTKPPSFTCPVKARIRAGAYGVRGASSGSGQANRLVHLVVNGGQLPQAFAMLVVRTITIRDRLAAANRRIGWFAPDCRSQADSFGDLESHDDSAAAEAVESVAYLRYASSLAKSAARVLMSWRLSVSPRTNFSSWGYYGG
jgi:hypothetical protein